MKKKRRQTMINAEDLRIGDLVIVSKTGCKIPKGTVCRVTAIETESMLFDDRFVSVRLIPIDPKCKQISWYDWCKNISTIPLTPEILEKNGWKRISHKGLPWALFRKKGCSVRIAYDSDDDKVPFSVGKEIQELKNINYVHELQHILWALGEDANLKI